MIKKQTLCSNRIRKISVSFAFIEHRFLQDGFWQTLNHHELLVYLFLVLVGDRNGLSYYSYDRICSLLRISVDEYLVARNSLIDRDLVAFDGRMFQVLSLPEKPINTPSNLLRTTKDMERHDPATIAQLVARSFA